MEILYCEEVVISISLSVERAHDVFFPYGRWSSRPRDKAGRLLGESPRELMYRRFRRRGRPDSERTGGLITAFFARNFGFEQARIF